jgi:ABC-type sugar transport system ATPase subunit
MTETSIDVPGPSSPNSQPGIQLRAVYKRYAGTPVLHNLDLQVLDGEFLVVVGPSGCGKSTLMRIVAGIEPHDGGTVEIGARDVTFARPGERNIGMVFQDYALYPHLSVAGNLQFGLKAHHTDRREIDRRVMATAKSLDIEALLRKKPGQLSGGQRQRVALGRAMIREPRAFLMDEPLSNLDAALRVQMRAELIEFHRRVRGTVLYVTHDQTEAMTMGDRVAVMNNGRFEQIDSPDGVYRRPATIFVAGFLGSPRMNLVDGVIQPADGETALVSAGRATWRIPATDLASEHRGPVVVGFRPEAVRLARADEPDSFSATTVLRENLGNEVIAHLDVEGTRVISRQDPFTAAQLDEVRQYRVSPAELHLFDPDGPALWHGDAARQPYIQGASR